MKKKTIRINDCYGKRWQFQERSIDGFYFDNIEPNNWVIITVNGAQLQVDKPDLADALPHVAKEMDIKLN